MSCQSEGGNQQTSTLNDVLKTEKSEAGQLQSLPSPFLASEEDSSLSNGTLDLVTGGGDSKKDTNIGAGIGAGIGAAVGVGVGGLVGLCASVGHNGCKKRVNVPIGVGAGGVVGAVFGAVAGEVEDQKRASKRT